MTSLLVGVDVGTTHLKVGIFDPGGHLVAFAQRDSSPEWRPNGQVQVDAALWWDCFIQSFRECLAQVGRSSIRAVSVSSQAQTYILLDGAKRPTGPAVTWLDATGDVEGGARGLADFSRHTGWPSPFAQLALCKLQRYRLQSGVSHLLFADGYLLYRLTNRAAVSRNLAAMSGLYSLEHQDWWAEALAVAGVPREVLPAICEVGQVVGELDSTLARTLEIPTVPVVAGANDQTAAALGAGLAGLGDTALGLGTALVTYQVIGATTKRHPQALVGPYLSGLHYRLLCGAGGDVIEWAKNSFFPGHSWQEFFTAALAVKPGGGGLRFRPDRGVLSGLSLSHGAAEMARAVLEGIACLMREQFETLDVRGVVCLTGGGTRNDAWAQVMADVVGRPLERLDQPQASLWGTALAAGYGAGMIPDLLEAARTHRKPGRLFVPRSDHAETYDLVYQDYQHLSGATQ